MSSLWRISVVDFSRLLLVQIGYFCCCCWKGRKLIRHERQFYKERIAKTAPNECVNTACEADLNYAAFTSISKCYFRLKVTVDVGKMPTYEL